MAPKIDREARRQCSGGRRRQGVAVPTSSKAVSSASPRCRSPTARRRPSRVHIFPEAMRGTGEGLRPWDLMPNSTMTNATVDSEVAGSDGQKLGAEIQGRRKDLHRAGGCCRRDLRHRGRAAALKPGAKIFVGRRGDQTSRRHRAGAAGSMSGSTASPRRCELTPSGRPPLARQLLVFLSIICCPRPGGRP